MNEQHEEFQAKLRAAMQWIFVDAPHNTTMTEAREYLRTTFGKEVEEELCGPKEATVLFTHATSEGTVEVFSDGTIQMSTGTFSARFSIGEWCFETWLAKKKCPARRVRQLEAGRKVQTIGEMIVSEFG